MSVIDKYIFKLCNAAIITVIGCLLTLTSLFALFEELNESDIAYGFWDAANYILATTPNRVQELLIYSVFLGLLISLGRLAESNELTILRTSGWSPLKILASLMPTILIWVIVSMTISEFLVPNSEKDAEIQKLQFVNNEDLALGSGGLWFKDKDLFMRISAFGNKNNIVGITQYRIDDKQRLAEVIYARSGNYQIEQQNWLLIDVKITTFGINHVTTSASSSRIWSNSISPDMLASQAFIEPKKMSLMELTRQINYLDDQNIAKSQYSLAFWSRVLEPFERNLGRVENRSRRVFGFGFYVSKESIQPDGRRFRLASNIGDTHSHSHRLSDCSSTNTTQRISDNSNSYSS